MFAARNGNPQAVKLLVEAGADVNARETAARHHGADVGGRAAASRRPSRCCWPSGADPARSRAAPGLPRNYMANRVNTRTVDLAQAAAQARGGRRPHLRGAARARADAKGASSAASAASGRRSARTACRSRNQRDADAARRPAGAAGAAGAGQRGRGAAGRGRGAGAAPARAAGGAGRRPDRRRQRGGVRGPGGQRRRRPDGARRSRRARATSSRRGRCSTPAPTSTRPPSTAGRRCSRRSTTATTSSRRFLLERGADPEPREQGRLDAALPRHRQPQHRGRRLSGAEAGSRSPRDHHDAARQGRQAERAGQGEHAHPHHLHDAVVLRGRRHAVRPRGAVERHRADEAAARSTAPIRRRAPPTATPR